MLFLYQVDVLPIHRTIVIVETLFSKCGHVLTSGRRRLQPLVFEAIIFLKENKDYWHQGLVQDMLTGKWDNRLGQDYISDEGDSDKD